MTDKLTTEPTLRMVEAVQMALCDEFGTIKKQIVVWEHHPDENSAQILDGRNRLRIINEELARLDNLYRDIARLSDMYQNIANQ